MGPSAGVTGIGHGPMTADEIAIALRHDS